MLPLYKNIRKRRIELNMSQQELADKLGYKSRSAINKIELGINDITQSKIIAFARALNTTASELMGDVENRVNPDDMLRFALWEGDSEIVDDEMLEDIRDYAKLLAEKKKRKLERKE